MNELLAMAQQALSWLGNQATALWNILAAVASNRPAPARQVAEYLVVFAVLIVLAPRIAKVGRKK